jgi:peptide chain release factor
VVKSQETRSRSQNRKIARQLLANKLEVLEKGAESRVAVKAAVKQKKKASKSKKAQRKYRKLDDEKVAKANEQGVEDLPDEGTADSVIEYDDDSGDLPQTQGPVK